jgi:alpha-tubulin suppressor-like RCC1 family protein
MRIPYRTFRAHVVRRGASLLRFLSITLTTLAGGAAVLQYPTSAVAFPYETYRWVWGDNERGELGNNSNVTIDSPQFNTSLPSSNSAIRLAAGSNIPLSGSHSLALDGNHNAWAWGNNIFGEVGDGGGNTAVFGPVQVCGEGETAPCSQFLGDITAIAAGGVHSLALDSFGNVWAWGWNEFGQLGSNIGNTAIPVRNNALFAQLHQLPGPPLVTAIAAGENHSLALDSRGVVWAWGANGDGQLGLGYDNSFEVYALPITFPEGTVITAIAAGANHSLALDSEGNVWAWGNNGQGQLGISSFDEKHNVPEKLIHFPPNTRITAIAGGGFHSLALDSGGNVWAWGANAAGQLGNGQNIQQNGPTHTTFPEGTPRILMITAGGAHNLAVDANHNVWAWGANGEGQLGNGQLPNPSNVPVRANLPEGTRIVTIAAGGFHSLALESPSAFLYGIEAVLDSALSTAQARVLPQSLTPGPVNLETTSSALDPAGNRVLVTNTMTDTMGNKLVLVLTQQRIDDNGLALQVKSVQYNDGAVRAPPPNRIEFHRQMDKDGSVSLLQQHLRLDQTNITTNYNAAKYQTKIDVETPLGPPQHFTDAGLVTVQMSTVNGNLSFSDGTRVWP